MNKNAKPNTSRAIRLPKEPNTAPAKTLSETASSTSNRGACTVNREKTAIDCFEQIYALTVHRSQSTL
jgi:hypothetical protein